jgi:septal ring factor EnvC (AmiA/AmiB activator)
MEGEERYRSWVDYNGNFELIDNESNQYISSLVKLDDLLNQQDKEIHQLKEENQQLKKQLKQSQNELAINELEKIRQFIVLNDEYDEEVGCNIIETFDLLEDISDRIEKLGGGENE